jgi:hypothetical protein
VISVVVTMAVRHSVGKAFGASHPGDVESSDHV